MAKPVEALVFGWEEWVALPELGLPAILSKIDTGAKTSALHAFKIEPFTDAHGTERVRFGIHPIPENPSIEVYCTADLVDRREIISSNGDSELRYIIRTWVHFGTSEHGWPIEISLANRETMTYRMLIGRSAMTEKAIINPEASCVCGKLPVSSYDYLPPTEPHQRQLHLGLLSREPKSYSTRRLMEAAVNRGHTVEVIHTTRCYMNITADKPEIHYQGRVLEHFDALIPRIGASITFYGLAVLRQFEMMGIYTLNSSLGINCSRDKLYAHQLLARGGIDMPVTAFAHSPDDTHDMVKTVGGPPLILKLLEGTQGKGIVLVETHKAAESVVEAFRGLKANILVQEFIAEAQGCDIRCFVLGNKVLAAIQRTAKNGDFRSNLHRGGTAKRVQITPLERAMAIRAAKMLGLRLAGVDIIRSKNGPKILEVNSSPGFEGIEHATGKDLAGLVIEYLERHARPGTSPHALYPYKKKQ